MSGLREGRTYIITANPYKDSLYGKGQYEVTINKGSNTQNITIQLKQPQIIGVVKAPDGNEEKAFMELFDAQNSEWITSTETTRDGRFALSGLVENKKYTIRAIPRNSKEYSNSKLTEFTYTNSLNGIEVTLTEAQIIGKVVDNQGSIVSLAGVEVREKETGKWVGYFEVNQSGVFRIGGLDDEKSYQIRAIPYSSVNLTPSKWTDANIGEQNKTLVLSPVQIYGKLLKEDTLTRLLGWVEIQKYLPKENKWIWQDGIGTDFEGNFKIGSLEDGKYKLKAYPFTNDEFAPSKELEIDVNSSLQNREVALTLRKPQAVGQIVDKNENRVFNGWVSIEKKNTNGQYTWYAGVGIDRNGNFALYDLEDVDYRLIAYPNFNNEELTPSDPFTIKVANGKITPSNIKIYLKNTQIRGKVNNHNNNGWVEVGEVVDGNIVWVKSVPVYSNGQYRISGLDKSKTYKIQAFMMKDGVKYKSDLKDLNLTEDISEIDLNIDKAYNDFTTKLFNQRIAATNLKLLFATNTNSLGNNQVKPEPSIVNIYAAPLVLTEGIAKNVNINITTSGIDDGTVITAQLMYDDGATSTDVPIASGVVNYNTSTLNLLVPSTLKAGKYIIKISIPSLNITNITSNLVVEGSKETIIKVVSVSENAITVGNSSKVKVTVITENVQDETEVQATLLNPQGLNVSGIKAVGKINNNCSELELNLQPDLESGEYTVKVQVGSK